MMELRHLAMVNWHLFEVEDIDIRGHVGVLGENRSGKSTILDMAQVVLTGANRNFQRLNAVAGDKGRSRGGSKRSVVDYCLGALGEDERQRDEALTYIALGFEDAEGVRPPVAVGIAMEARKSESNETVLGRFVVVGKILKTDDFIEVRKDGRFPAQWDAVRARIIGSVGEQNFVNHRDRAGDYVREYMRHLLPHASFIGDQNATSLQKAIVNAMTLDHEQTATQFVREYILERNPMRVGELRESIQTYRNINETIRTMRRRLEALKALWAILAELDDAYDRKYLEDWISARAEWLSARSANREFKERFRLECAQRDAAGERLDALAKEIEGIEAEIERLNIAIIEHDTKTGRRGLVQDARIAEQTANQTKAAFHKRLDRFRFLQPLCAVRGLGFDPHIPMIERLVGIARDVRIEKLQQELAAAEANLISVGPALLQQVDEARQKLFRDAADQRERRDRIRERIQQHSTGHARAHLSPSTEELCRRLRHERMAPRVLCDLIEVAQPEWTAAAEGLLGRDREAVFVDRSDIADATVIFKEGRRDFRGASLVSLNKLEAFRTAPVRGTFPSIFRSQDFDAMSFIMRRYGSVRLASTIAEFNAPGRAIMKDALYDDGLVRTHRARDSTDYKIGKSAQARALRDLQEQADELGEVADKTSKAATAIDAAHAALRALCEDSATLPVLADAHAAALKEQREAFERITSLDGTGDGGLREKHKAQTGLKTARAGERTVQQGILNKHAGEATFYERKLVDRENVPGSALNVRMAWAAFLKALPLYDRGKGRAAYRTRIAARRQKSEVDRHRAIASRATAASAEADADRITIERRAREALGAYFDENVVSSQVGTESPLLAEVKPWAEQMIEEIETNELRRYERQAQEAAEKASTLLRGEFINALTSRISKMDRELQAMNRGLRQHPFHNERYSFHHNRVAEFQPILKIMEISKTSPEALDMLFRGDQVPEDFPHKDTIAELESLLEDPEKDFTQFEDYRNFYTFEIYMEDVGTGRRTRWETRRGTGSGAEQQVPIYVAIGASLASVYASAERRAGRPSGIALAIFDEAFSKMDGKNQRQMMSFYKNLGLQIIIAAPFEKRVALLEHMDTIVEVDRIGERSRATVVQLKARARQEIRAMDPDRMSDGDLAARIAAE